MYRKNIFSEDESNSLSNKKSKISQEGSESHIESSKQQNDDTKIKKSVHKSSIENFFRNSNNQKNCNEVKHATTTKTNDECNSTEGCCGDTFKESNIDNKSCSKSKLDSNNDLLAVVEEKKVISKHNIAETKQTKFEDLSCPKDYDPEVWKELPEDLKKELISNQDTNSINDISADISASTSTSTFDHVDNKPTEVDIDDSINNNAEGDVPESTIKSDHTDSNECPEGVDQEVFNQLPEEIRSELSRTMSNDTGAKTSSGDRAAKKYSLPTNSSGKKSAKGSKKESGSKSQSILNFFSRQK